MGGKVSRTLEEAHREQHPNLSLKALSLQTFPPIICDHFIWLVKLNLADNHITVIPNEIYKLRNLKVLQLSSNRISCIPPELGMLGHLQVLELDNNVITNVHQDLCNLRALQELTLFFNKLKELPSQIGKMVNLTKLIVEKNELTTLPSDIGRLSALQTLHAGDNQIERLPEEFGQLEHLTMLSFASNCLTQLPASFGKLTNLSKLNLRSNRLSRLGPSQFKNLTQLTTLALWSNEFTEFPTELTHLTNLTDLSINGNKITSIPPSIKHLVRLQKLYLQHNELEFLPTEFKCLTSLHVLLLQENRLQNLPCEICFLPIQNINFDKNPLPSNYAFFFQKGNASLLAYLQKDFQIKQNQSATIIQKWYRTYRKTRRFRGLVKLIIETNRQAKLVAQFQMDLRKKQAVVTLQRLFRSRKRRNMFRSVVTSAHTEYRRSTSMATLAPPPTSVYVFTPREVGEIVFDETDSEETITWGDAATESSPKLKLSGSFTGITRQPTIKSATIVKLIEKLTCDNNDDPDFVNTVLYTMETFTTPTCFLDLLSKRYADAIALDKQPIKQKVAELLHTWVTDHPYYFELDTKFTNKFKNFVNGTVAPDFPQICGDLIEDMEARQAHKNRSMSGVTNLVEFLSNAPKSYPIPRDIPLKNLQLCLDVNPEEIARQLTLIDYFLLCRINPTEFVNQRWTRSGKEKAAGNILAMIERFNQVSQWAATEICTEESLKIRTTKIKRFIDIGMKCLELKNFNGVMQIVTGLNSSAVARLKTTWNNVSARRKEGFASLEKLMDMNNNFRNYRELLASTPPPCIPFLGLFLTDFTFIDDGNPNFSHKNQINMVKRRLTAEGMRTITQCASKPFCLVPVSVIQEKLLNCDALDDMTLYKHSLKLERKSVSQTTLRKSLASALPNLKKTSFG